MARTNNRLTNQGVWIGAGPGTEDATSLFVPGQLGMVYVQADKVYQFVLFHSGTSTIANGTPVTWQDADDFVVTAEADSENRGMPAGVALGSQTAGRYGWIQVGGPHSAVIQAQNFAVGETAIISTTDGSVLNIAVGTAPTFTPLGVAIAATASGTVALQIIAPHNGW